MQFSKLIIFICALVLFILTGCAPVISKNDYGHGFISQKIGAYYLVRSFSQSGIGSGIKFQGKNYMNFITLEEKNIKLTFFIDIKNFTKQEISKIRDQITNQVSEISYFSDVLESPQYKVIVSIYLTNGSRISKYNTSLGYRSKHLVFAFAIDLKATLAITQMLATVVHELVHATEPHTHETSSHSLLESEILASTIQVCYLINALPNNSYLIIDSRERGNISRSVEDSDIGERAASKLFLSLLNKDGKYVLYMRNIKQVDIVKRYCRIKLDSLRHPE